MKSAPCLFLFGLLIAAISTGASPLPEERHDRFEELEIFGRQNGDGSELVRMKRASCDLFDIFNPGNSVCAAHCIWMGNRGGKCVDSVCHCRK